MSDPPFLLILAFGVHIAACDRATPAPAASSTDTPPAPRASTTASAKGTLAGARERMDAFLADGADHRVLTQALAPKPEDHARVFAETLASKASAHYASVFDGLTIAPEAGQTELLMWKVTTEELRRGTGDAVKCSPQYREVASQLAEGFTWYCFKLVVPGEKVGTESEGLVFVNGHWALFPAPWSMQ